MNRKSFENYLKKLEKGDNLNKDEVLEVCSTSINVLILEPNLPQVESPVKICGDIHGQFYDLLEIFNLQGAPKNSKYVFLGDFVDRGSQSVSTYLTLLIYKILYPHNITLIRGNHESIAEIRKDLGFYREIMQMFPECYDDMYTIISQTFLYLNVGCIVDGRVLCVHGGLSPHLRSIKEIQEIDRFKKDTDKNYLDIMWSDPKETKGFEKSPRGMGYLFGSDVVKRFLLLNNLNYLVRAHQYVKEGYKFDFSDKNTITVWSAPNYMYRFNNVASVLLYYGQMEITKKDFFIFRDADHIEDSNSF